LRGSGSEVYLATTLKSLGRYHAVSLPKRVCCYTCGIDTFHKHGQRAMSHSDPVPATILADVHVAAAALQDILVVSCLAHFTLKAPPRPVRKDALKTTGVLALVVVLEVSEDLVDACASLVGEHVCRCVSVDDFLRALFDAVDVGGCTVAIFPVYAADVAEFCFADTP
jgi:hypothetical protein